MARPWYNVQCAVCSAQCICASVQEDVCALAPIRPHSDSTLCIYTLQSSVCNVQFVVCRSNSEYLVRNQVKAALRSYITKKQRNMWKYLAWYEPETRGLQKLILNLFKVHSWLTNEWEIVSLSTGLCDSTLQQSVLCQISCLFLPGSRKTPLDVSKRGLKIMLLIPNMNAGFF